MPLGFSLSGFVKSFYILLSGQLVKKKREKVGWLATASMPSTSAEQDRATRESLSAPCLPYTQPIFPEKACRRRGDGHSKPPTARKRTRFETGVDFHSEDRGFRSFSCFGCLIKRQV